MASFTPTNIIKTPDFGSMAEGLINQKRQENAEMNQMMDRNQQLYGSYLEGDKPAVQEAWDIYQKALDAMVESNSPVARRKANEAYGYYAQLAGAAQANSQMFREQVAQYRANPGKFAISGSDFLDKSDSYRLQKRTADEIFGSVNNPFILESKMAYDLSNPIDEAQRMLSMSSAKLKDFYNEEGQLNRAGLRAYATELARAKATANDVSFEKAMAWGGVREGYAGGPDGMISSMDEIEFLRQQPEERRNTFVDSYVNELVENYMRLVPSKIERQGAATESGQAKKQLATEQISIQAAGGQLVNFVFLPSAVDGIQAIGVSPDGEYFVQVKTKQDVEDEETLEISKETIEEIRPATRSDIAKVISKYGNTYDLSVLGQKSVSSQQEEPSEKEVINW